jgi:MFS transporter, FHS family, L-fucose permease
MKSNENAKPLAALTLLFFMWGFITCMNDILIPHLKELFELTYLKAMLVQFCFFGAYFTGSLIYFLISVNRGDPINRIGYKNGILLGLLIAAIGCALFYPAASYHSYGLFLGAFFTVGLGFTLLQIAANPYASLLGPEESASSRLNMVQAFNAFGTTIAPILGGYLIFQFFSDGEALSPRATQLPYLVFSGLFLVLILVISRVKLPAFQTSTEGFDPWGALRFPQLRLGAFAIFAYVGAEVAIGSFLISFITTSAIPGLPEAVAKNYLSLYWGGAMIGRFAGAIALNHSLSAGRRALWMALSSAGVFLLIFMLVDLDLQALGTFLVFIVLNFLAFLVGRSAAARSLAIFGAVNVLLVLASVFLRGEMAMWALVATGLFNSIMWSNIFTLAIAGMGRYTSQGSSLLVMAILGGALIPPVQGALADKWGLHISFIVPAVCYLYILWFGARFSSAKVEPVKKGMSLH